MSFAASLAMQPPRWFSISFSRAGASCQVRAARVGTRASQVGSGPVGGARERQGAPTPLVRHDRGGSILSSVRRALGSQEGSREPSPGSRTAGSYQDALTGSVSSFCGHAGGLLSSFRSTRRVTEPTSRTLLPLPVPTLRKRHPVRGGLARVLMTRSGQVSVVDFRPHACPRHEQASTRETALSQHCLRGQRVEKTLSKRTHYCPRCGLAGDRDAISRPP